MLVRILNGIEEDELRRRVRSLLQQHPNVLVQGLRKASTPVWARITRYAGELVILSRSHIPEPTSESVAALRQVPDAPELVVIGAMSDREEQARLTAAGCYAFLDSQIDDGLLERALAELIERIRKEATETIIFEQEVEKPRLSDFVTQSPAMRAFMDVVERVVDSDATLLITGETGVGKERLARAAHEASRRSKNPFIAVNCGALPETLLDSELFGHREGAFTGATRTRRGWFELAHRGTIFLDEIGEMPLPLQVRLLRVLQAREVTPVGAEASVPVDVRIIAATNCDLEEATRDKRFRSDLYYRLSVVKLEVPPLRERLEDVAGLARSYLHYFQSRFATSVARISEEALEALERYSWPGNIRELVNVIERAMLLCRGDTITTSDLPGAVAGEGPEGEVDIAAIAPWTAEIVSDAELLSHPFREVRERALESLERRYFSAVLRETGGRINEAAEIAGMTTRNLFEKLQRLGLRKEDFKR